MHKLLLAAAGLALLVPAALAQTAPGGPGMGAFPPGGPHGPGLMPPPPPPPSRAAHFHLQHGDVLVDVKCADDETTKACTETVTGLLDKLVALPAPAKN